MLIRHHLLLLDLPPRPPNPPPLAASLYASASHQRKPADCQGCRRARLCPVRGTHTKSASFKDSVAGLTGRYRTSLLVWLASFCLVEIGLKVSPLPRLDLPLCSDELILPRYHFTQTAISQRRTVSLRRASHGRRGPVLPPRGCDELSDIGRNTDLALADTGLGATLRLSLRAKGGHASGDPSWS